MVGLNGGRVGVRWILLVEIALWLQGLFFTWDMCFLHLVFLSSVSNPHLNSLRAQRCWHELPPAPYCVSGGRALKEDCCLLINNWRSECGEELDAPLDFLLSLNQEGPISPIASPWRIKIHFLEHGFLDRQVVTN